jgi:hypothetical protein
MVWASALVIGRGRQRSHQLSVAPSRRIVEPIRCSPSGIRLLKTCNRMAKTRYYWDGVCESGSKCEVTDTRSARKITLLRRQSVVSFGYRFRRNFSKMGLFFFGTDMAWIVSRFQKGSGETDLEESMVNDIIGGNDTRQYSTSIADSSKSLFWGSNLRRDFRTSWHNGINHTFTCRNATNTQLGSIGQFFAYKPACIGHTRAPSRFIQISAWPTPSALT